MLSADGGGCSFVGKCDQLSKNTALPTIIEFKLEAVLSKNVAVPGRNQTLFRCVFRAHYRVRTTVTQNFRWGWGPYGLDKCVKYS